MQKIYSERKYKVRTILPMLMFSFFFEKQSCCYENDYEKSKTKRSFLKTIDFLKVRFFKMLAINRSFKKNVFKNDRFYKTRRFVNNR